MTRANTLRIRLAALVAASAIAVPAMGQVRATQDGHATDGSNRVGSGGYNTAGGGTGARVTGDQIIYGDVTGGRAFSGPLHEPDAKGFFGPTGGGISDRFVKSSAGAPLPYQPVSSASDAQPFYGLSRGVAAPSGSERLGFTGGYLGTSSTPSSPLALSSDITSNSSAQAQPLGRTSLTGNDAGSLQAALGQTYLNGPLEAQIGANTFAGSPLYGIRNSLANGMGESNSQAVYGLSASTSSNLADRSRIQNSDVQRMRTEVLRSSTDLQPDGQSPNDNPQAPGALSTPNLNRPLEGPENTDANNRLNAPALNSPNLAGAQTNQQGVIARSTLTPARVQNDQYNRLKQRLERYQNPQMTQILANQRSQRDLQAARTRGAVNSPTSRPAGALTTPQSSMIQRDSQPNFEPLAVGSLATGVKARGLHDLLQSAEDLMREGKFQSAIDRYNTAEQVDSNNALIPLGRANAELGAGYYHQASVDLHQVFESEPALLMGQYNLKNWMNPQRLQFMQKELNDLAASDPNQEMPVFLLGYIAYNTGDVAQAKDFLNEARKRAGNGDPLLEQLETHWTGSRTQVQPRPENLNK